MKIPMRDLTKASRQVATKSAMNPILWSSAIVTPAALTLGYFAPGPLSYILVSVGALPVVITGFVFTLFAIRDPNRLQSETHFERMEVLARMQNPETGDIMTIDAEPSASNAPRLEVGS